MNKTLSKETMKRTRLRNKFLKNRNDYNKREFSKQRNYTVYLLLENPKSYIIAILMKKRSRILKLFGRPLNRSFPIKLCQDRK